MKHKFMKIVKGKVFLGVFLFGLIAAAIAAVSSTVLRENDQQNEQLNLGETDDGQFAQMPEPTEIEIVDVGADKKVEAQTTKEETTQAPTEPEEVAAVEETQPVPVDSGNAAPVRPALSFTTESKLEWPIQGNVILDYNMDSTVYFSTLQQYKCNPAVLIQGDVSSPVKAGVIGKVLEVGQNEEIGNYVVLDLGNSFAATYGQLKDITVLEGDYVEADRVLGYVAEPTKYFVVEGSNLYFKLTCEDQPVDPVDFIQ